MSKENQPEVGKKKRIFTRGGKPIIGFRSNKRLGSTKHGGFVNTIRRLPQKKI